MKKWSADNVASLFHQISLAPSHKNFKKKGTPHFENQFPSFDPQTRSIEECFEPRIQT